MLEALPAAAPARADLLGNGPLLLAGYSPDQDVNNRQRDIALLSVGWRWHFQGADFLDNFFAKAKTDFSWSVEPTVGGIFGDAHAFEASVVPLARFAPLGWTNVVPYFEGGIGLIFTTLQNYGLGSEVLFSDNAGIGVTFGSDDGLRWSVGYRFRHISHAKIFGHQNEGLNAHFLVIEVE
jgi:hypothetical protein